MDAEEIYWNKKNRHEISMKNTNKHGRYGKKKMMKDEDEVLVKKKKRHHPRIGGGLLNAEPEIIECLDDKVTRYLETEGKWVYRKTRNNIGKLVHVEPKCFDDLKDNVTAYCVASCAEWYVILDPASNRECFLWNCVSHQKIQLPKLRINFKKCFKCILTAPPTERRSEVVFFNRNGHFILCSGFDYKKWTSIAYHLKEDLCSQAISCNKKIYAIKSSGKVLYEIKTQLGAYVVFHASTGEETTVCAEKQHLVESCGEVFLVQRFSTSRLETYRMDFTNNEWVRIYSLGDRVFFLGRDHSVSLAAQELGIEGNCIYFLKEDSDRLDVFNLTDQSLYVSHNLPNSGTLWLLWEGEIPVLRLANNSCNEQREPDIKVAMDINGEGESSTLFNLLPLDVVGKIGRSLGVGRDYMNFRLVCRSWSLAAPAHRWRHDDLSSSVMTYPWLLFFNRKEKDTCDFYDPGGHVTYHKKAPGLPSDIIIRFSNEGWLLCSEGEKSWFLFEQFTHKRIELPDPPCLNLHLCGMCFSGSPGSSDFVVAGIAQVDPETSLIFLLHSTSKYWLEYDVSFIPSRTSPVCLHGKFHFLGQDGSLGQFTVDEHGAILKILDQNLQFPTTVYQSFLVSYDKNFIFSVFVGDLGEWVHVYAMTMSGKWAKLEHLGNYTLFISQATSILVRAQGSVAAMKNRIYFPVFSKTDGKNTVFYSMETSTFETKDGGSFTRGNLCDTEELLNCSWFHHRMITTH